MGGLCFGVNYLLGGVVGCLYVGISYLMVVMYMYLDLMGGVLYVKMYSFDGL